MNHAALMMNHRTFKIPMAMFLVFSIGFYLSSLFRFEPIAALSAALRDW